MVRLLLLALPWCALAQRTPAEIATGANPSLAIVLAGKTPNQTGAIGAAVAIRQNGVLLTAYHLVKDARAVQVRLKSGEVFDQVQLLGVDPRRDVVAIKITGTLAALPVANASGISAGDMLAVVSLSSSRNWSVSEAAVTGYSMSDEIAGAGKGYRVIRFTVSGGAVGSSGVLLDHGSNGVALMAGSNFAVPLDSVLGLADAAVSKTFSSGAALKLPEQIEAKTPVTPPPATPNAAPRSSVAPGTPSANESKDRRVILRNLQTIYINAEGAKTFGNSEMKAALVSNQEFSLLRLQIAGDPNAADAILEVRNSLGAEYAFELKSRNGVLLFRGTDVSLTPSLAARDVARYFVQLARPFRPDPKK